jgi:hypothetical protein
MKLLVLTTEPIDAGQLRDALPADAELRDGFGLPVDRAEVSPH